MFKQKEILLLISIVLVGFCFRLFLVLDLPIWIDETFTLNHIKLSLLDLVSGKFDATHPFGYYLFLKLWSLISSNLLWLRCSTLIFYLLNSFLFYKLAVLTKQKNLTYLLLILYAFSGYFIVFDWQARMYTGVLTLILVSWYSFKARKNLLFSIINIYGLYFDYAFVWYLIPLTLLILYQTFKKIKNSKLTLIYIVSTWLVFALWIPTFLTTYKNGIEAINWTARFTTPTFFLPYFLGSHNNIFITIFIMFFSLYGIFITFLKDKTSAQFFISARLSSGFLAFVLSFFVGSIFHVRNLQIVALMFLITIAICLDWLWKCKHRYLVLIFLLIYFISFLLTIRLHYILPSSLLLKF